MSELKIFYDGGCPLCLAEMKHLLKLDQHNKIDLVDINQADFQTKHPNINRAKADQILHGQLTDGSILLGLDVTHKAWSLVGKGKWTAILRWPLIRPIADFAYLQFARHRHFLSRLITGQERCESCNLERKKC
jgi:predicted DCC family thiol-disulfide oxidoreductase YuxK